MVSADVNSLMTPAGSTEAGTAQGSGLGQAQQVASNFQSQLQQAQGFQSQLRSQQIQQQQLQQQLQDAQFDSVTKRAQQQMNISDPDISKKVAAQNAKQTQGLVYDGFWDDLNKGDSTLRQGLQAALKYSSGQQVSPEDKMAALKAMQDPYAAHQYADIFATRQQQEANLAVADLKAKEAKELAKVKGGYNVIIGQGHDNARVDAAQPGNDLKQDRLDESVHGRALREINGDSQLNALQTSYQNLGNSLTNFQASGRNPEEFAQLQQSLRANAGIKGGSTGSERADSYLHDYGITAQEFMQKLSGNPQDIMKSSPDFVKLVEHVADAELENKRKQARGQLDRLSRGHQSFYSKYGNEGRAQDYSNVVNGRYKQFDLAPGYGQQPQQQQPAQQQVPQAPAPQAAQAPAQPIPVSKMSAQTIQDATAQAKKAGFSDAQIQAYLKGK